MSRLSSAKGLLALLQDGDTSVIHFALNKLNSKVDEFWHEITSDLALVEELHESTNLPEDVRCKAALLASRVFFHLGEYDDSVHFALNAGKFFDGSKKNENTQENSLYTQTILGRCIDLYVADREKPDADKPIDPRLEKLFNSLAEKWQATDDNFLTIKELIGFTIRARRLDLLELALAKHVDATKSAEMLTFTLNVVNLHVNNIGFRRDVLRALTKMYSENLNSVDYFALTKCLVFLGDAPAMAKVILDLLDKKQSLIAYQIGFDLFDFANQDYIQTVADEMQKSVQSAEGDDAPALDQNIMEIMTGKVTTSYFVKFLYSKCNADIHVLNQTKKSIDPKASVTQTATIIANALMYSGTTIDGFLRDNMEWLGKTQHWAKFTTTATVGAIHRGHIDESMNILKPYLPDANNLGPAPFQEAGALYALGLINNPIGVGSSKETVDYLRNALRTYSTSEQLVHGSSLGLGLAAMGLQDEELFDALFACVSGCDAVAGEGAALAIGMVMLGSGNMRIVEMLKNHASAYDQKEKTIRGLAMAIALIMMGRENDADATIDEMLAHADHWVRVGGCFTIGLAYAGTGNTHAIEKLLDVSVRDVSDEVRRIAVMMVGFLTFKDVSSAVEMTRILSDSYNPHIRYGVAMALGIAGAGTGDKGAIDLLWTLKDDGTDFVRQGAIIALSMVMIQLTEATNPKVKEFRDLLKKKIADKKEDTCTKFGCILATGLIDGGGRNCTISLHRDRLQMTKSIVGVFMFCQYWYWFPYTLMLTMSFQPTCVIGLNEQLVMPQYEMKSEAAPSTFAIPKSVMEEKKEAKSSGVKKVVLSTTRKELEFRNKKKMGRENSSVALDLEEAVDAAEKDTKKDDAKDTEEKKEEEPKFEIIANPARVTRRQLDVIVHTHDERYTPLKDKPMGVCMLKDNKPEEEQVLVEKINPMDRDDDVPPPEPFEYP